MKKLIAILILAAGVAYAAGERPTAQMFRDWQAVAGSRTVASAAPILGKAVWFDGVNAYIDTRTNNLLVGTNAFSISAWISHRSSGTFSPILSSGIFGGTVWDGFLWQFDSSGALGNGVGALWPVMGQSTWNHNIACGPITGSEWKHVVVTRTGAGLVKTYLDSVGSSGGTEKGNVTVARNLLIGRNPDTTYPRNWAGSIDELAFWDRALSATEVTNLYNSGNGVYGDVAIPPFNSGLLALWHFDEGTGTNTANTVGGSPVSQLVTGASWTNGKVFVP